MNEVDMLITKTQKTCDELILLLNNEKNILINSSTDTLNNINNDKEKLLLLLNSYEKELNNKFISMELINENNKLSNESSLKLNLETKKWEGLIESLKKCQALNNRNGYIINTSLTNTQSTLAILRGQEQNNNTYSKKGDTKQSLEVRTIAKI